MTDIYDYGVIPKDYNNRDVYAMRGKIATVGLGGRFSNLTDAFAERAAESHTLLATFTGSVTGTTSGSLPVHRISADSGTPLTAFKNLHEVGVRIGGSGPIVRGFIGGNTYVMTEHPIPQDYASVQIDVYSLKWGAIALLPGTVLEDATEHLHIPAFTTLCALVPHSATIVKASGTGLMFAGYAEQNESHVCGLNLIDPFHGSGSWLLNIPTTATHANQVMCDYSLKDCLCSTASEDFVYFGNPNPALPLLAPAAGNSGGFHARGNVMEGSFDLFFIGNARQINISQNKLKAVSINYDIDGGNACGVAYGGVADWAYPEQRHLISGNSILARGLDSPAGTEAQIISGVEMRGLISPPSNLHLRVANNQIHAEIQGGDGLVGGMLVTASGVTTPTIEFVDNSVYVKNNGAGTVTAVIAQSSSAAADILAGGNTVPAGGSTTYGTNVTAATFYAP